MTQKQLIIVAFMLLSLLNCCDNQVEPSPDWFKNRVQPYWFEVDGVGAHGDTFTTTIGIKGGRWLENTTTVGGPLDRSAVVAIYNISSSLDWVVEISFDGNSPVYNVFRLINDEPHLTLRNASLWEFEDRMFSQIRIMDQIQ